MVIRLAITVACAQIRRGHLVELPLDDLVAPAVVGKRQEVLVRPRCRELVWSGPRHVPPGVGRSIASPVRRSARGAKSGENVQVLRQRPPPCGRCRRTGRRSRSPPRCRGWRSRRAADRSRRGGSHAAPPPRSSAAPRRGRSRSAGRGGAPARAGPASAATASMPSANRVPRAAVRAYASASRIAPRAARAAAIDSALAKRVPPGRDLGVVVVRVRPLEDGGEGVGHAVGAERHAAGRGLAEGQQIRLQPPTPGQPAGSADLGVRFVDQEQRAVVAGDPAQLGRGSPARAGSRRRWSWPVR